MARKLLSIYELFPEYLYDEVDKAIASLSSEDKKIVEARYGKDLHNPVSTEEWNSNLQDRFYKNILKKIQLYLLRNRVNELSLQINDIQKDYSKEILELVQENTNGDEIRQKLGIDTGRFLLEISKLESIGVTCKKTYYSDGKIFYQAIKSFKDVNNIMNNTLITDTHANTLKFMIISDLHFGNKLERRDLLDRVFNYCIKNNIHIILCTGDLIDGTFTRGEQFISDAQEQLEYFVENYPSQKGIITFGVAGDHDESLLYNCGYNITKMIDHSREDIIVSSFSNFNLFIKNDSILLYHQLKSVGQFVGNYSILFKGHTHEFKIDTLGDILIVNVPTLSDIINPFPTALEMEINFIRGYINSGILKHVYFADNDKDIILQEQLFSIPKNKNANSTAVANIEDFKTRRTILNYDSANIEESSQVEKFYQRYRINGR